MSEDIEVQDTGAEAGVDPAAVALALGGASREDAHEFLKKQGALIDDQRHHLREQLKQLRLNIWEKYLGVLLRVATAVIGLAVAVAAVWLIWDAATSNALVIDAFSVPPDLAARGLSGPVVAAKLSDKITQMQAETNSQRTPKSYANSLTDGLRLDIPETGISLSELDNFLHDKLGHDLHIGGELVQTDSGVALTVRVGSDGSATVTGSEAGMDDAVQKLAEQVYRITQPYRYSIWLRTHGRVAEAIALMSTLATSGPNSERAWAYVGWGATAVQAGGEYEGLDLFRKGQLLDPENYLLQSNIGAEEFHLGRLQDSQRDYIAALALLKAHGQDYTLPGELEGVGHQYQSMVMLAEGALPDAAGEARKGILTDPGTGAIAPTAALAESLAGMHEPNAARAALTDNQLEPPYSPSGGTRDEFALQARMMIAAETQDWPGVLNAEKTLPQLLAQYPGLANSRSTMIDPLAAVALAHTGQFDEAEARLNPMPADCYPCLRARAKVAALQGQNDRADYWFARAAAIGPSLPFAESEWGSALLDRGKPDDAIAKFILANQKGPHFADPLEGWGEALMAKNRSDQALAKFEEAAKYAPNWGRLHLKWGEALYYAGKKDDAAKQFAQAAALDLTPSDKADLAAMNHG